jgi:hypothetical protein
MRKVSRMRRNRSMSVALICQVMEMNTKYVSSYAFDLDIMSVNHLLMSVEVH